MLLSGEIMRTIDEGIKSPEMQKWILSEDSVTAWRNAMGRNPDITFANVGRYFLKDGEVWLMIGWCQDPTAYMMNVKTEEQKSFGISGAISVQYQMLEPKVTS